MNIFKLFKNKEKKHNRIFIGDKQVNFFDTNDLNYLIIGQSGCRKTINFFIPNILKQKEDSLIIYDYNKEVFNVCRGDLVEKGYKIVYLNFFEGNIWRENILNEHYYKYFSIENDEDITNILNEIYNIKDEDDYYENFEVSLIRVLFKYLWIEKQKEISTNNNISRLSLSRFIKEFDFCNLEDLLKYKDTYIEENYKDFMFFIEEFDYESLKIIKEKILKKIDNERSFKNLDFKMLRNEKIAVFIETLTNIPDKEEILKMNKFLVDRLMEQTDGLNIKIFAEDFNYFNFEDFNKVLPFFNFNKMSIYTGIQSLEKTHKEIIKYFNNFVVFSRIILSDKDNILEIDDTIFEALSNSYIKSNEVFLLKKNDNMFNFKYVKLNYRKILRKIHLNFQE